MKKNLAGIVIENMTSQMWKLTSANKQNIGKAQRQFNYIYIFFKKARTLGGIVTVLVST